MLLHTHYLRSHVALHLSAAVRSPLAVPLGGGAVRGTSTTSHKLRHAAGRNHNPRPRAIPDAHLRRGAAQCGCARPNSRAIIARPSANSS